MSRRVPSEYLRLEKRIASGERDTVPHRWRYGRDLLKARAGRQRLPHGLLADRVAEAERAGLKGVNRRELQHRMAFAEAYPTEAHMRTAVRLFGSWSALRDAGFPSVPDEEVGDLDLLDELDATEIAGAAPDEFEQLTLIPGYAAILKIGGRRVPLDEATVADIEAYTDMCVEMHENYSKRMASMLASRDRIRAGAAGDPNANAVEAYGRGAA
jgi:hypothetical protein